MVRKQDKLHKDKNVDFRDDELYVCSGHFQTDFTVLCRRSDMTYIPPVVLRAIPPCDVKPEKVKGKHHSQAQAQAEQELNEKGEPIEPPPKTFITKDSFEYFKPNVQVHMDNPDKQDTVTEVYIRGWKIDTRMMDIFRQCWPLLQRLHTINLWNAGLTGEVISILAGFLPECSNVKNLILDGNWVREENWHELIGDKSSIQNLSLRNCMITDKGAEGIGKALGTIEKINNKLVSLSLAGNKITDKGCEHLARGLRMNRTLLVLSLGNNDIGDVGCAKLAEVLSTYPLTHEEVVERRKQMSKRKVPMGSTKFMKIVQSNLTKSINKVDRSSAKQKKDSKGKDMHGAGRRSRRKERGKKGEKAKENQILKMLSRLYKPARTSSSSSVGGEGKRGGKRDKKAATPEPLELSPVLKILEKVTPVDDQLWVGGNRVLLSLNLSRNRITAVGVAAMLKAMKYQDEEVGRNDISGKGLMRFNMQKNLVPQDHELMMQLDSVMTSRDPISKPPVVVQEPSAKERAASGKRPAK